jgi:nucleoside 2-deoxyribosyltransferase
MQRMPCPICFDATAHETDIPMVAASTVECRTCGAYEAGTATIEWLQQAANYPQPQRWKLSAATRHAALSGNRLRLVGDLAPTIEAVPVPPTPLGKMDLIVRYVEQQSSSGGTAVLIRPDHDYPLFYAFGSEEMSFLANALVHELRLLHVDTDRRYRLTVKGWQYLQELRRRLPQTLNAFVAMWFSEELRPAWEEAFRPTLYALGYDPVRIDLIEHNNRIDDEIVAHIRRAPLLVADVTGHRGGVYFEAGFGMGLGIPVIWTCRENEIALAHFDTRQYSHVLWTDTANLTQRLRARIEATIVNRPPPRP